MVGEILIIDTALKEILMNRKGYVRTRASSQIFGTHEPDLKN